jgi:hypothetical protein
MTTATVARTAPYENAHSAPYENAPYKTADNPTAYVNRLPARGDAQ